MGARPSFPVVPLDRRQVIVTGGNTGLGYVISKWLAIMGADVVIACRSEQRATEAIRKMNDEYQTMKDTVKEKHNLPVRDSLSVEFMMLDLSSFQSTLEFAEKYKSSGRPLHILILNAGIAMTPFVKTGDGFEQMLQVNFLSHFIVTAKLLPLMRSSGDDCRLLLMSSDAHRTCSFDKNAMNYDGNPNKFGRLDYYGRSKLCQIMQMHVMARRLKGTNITVNSCHPGIVETEINRNFNDSFFWNTVFFKGSKLLGKTKTPEEGAASMINAAVNPELANVSGVYYSDCKPGYSTPTARNEENQEAMWKCTLEFLHEFITPEELDCLEGRVASQ